MVRDGLQALANRLVGSAGTANDVRAEGGDRADGVTGLAGRSAWVNAFTDY